MAPVGGRLGLGIFGEEERDLHLQGIAHAPEANAP